MYTQEQMKGHAMALAEQNLADAFKKAERAFANGISYMLEPFGGLSPEYIADECIRLAVCYKEERARLKAVEPSIKKVSARAAGQGLSGLQTVKIWVDQDGEYLCPVYDRQDPQ